MDTLGRVYLEGQQELHGYQEVQALLRLLRIKSGLEAEEAVLVLVEPVVRPEEQVETVARAVLRYIIHNPQ